jgi:glyoxylase-like metal-dependent hydrolase (beta-lactamase superfamily II)
MRVHAIQTGTVAIKQRQRRGKGAGIVRLINTMLDREWTEPLPIYAWVIEHPEGLIVVDTGETSRTSEPGYFPAWHPYHRLCVRLDVAAEQEIGPQMCALGLSPDDVRWVVMTHLHTDHAGGLHHFPKAEILVSRKEFAAASGLAGQRRGYLPHRWPTWFAPRLLDLPAAPFGPFPQSLALTGSGDILLVPTEGHTVGHLSVIVMQPEVNLFLAGDVSYTQQLMLDQAVDGVAPKEQLARESLRRIARFVEEQPTIFLPSHDPETVQRLMG